MAISPTGLTNPLFSGSPEQCEPQPCLRQPSPMSLGMGEYASTFYHLSNSSRLPLAGKISFDTFDDTQSIPSLVDDCGSRQNSGSSVTSTFLYHDGPWSSCNPRQPAPSERLLEISCEECGTIFTGNYRKGNLSRHARHAHAATHQDFRLRCRVCDKKYQRTDARKAHERKKHGLHGGCSSADEHVASNSPSPEPTCSGSSPSNHLDEGFDIQSVDLENTALLGPISLSQPSIFLSQNPYISDGLLRGLVNRLDVRKNPNQMNSFCNVLDLLAVNLAQRFPGHPLVSGLLRALPRLDYGFQAQIPHLSGFVSDQWTLAWNDAEVTTYAGGMSDSARSPHFSSEPPPNLSSWSPSEGDSSGRGQEQDSRGKKGSRGKTKSLKHKKPTNQRLLACPIDKHCAAYGIRPVCSFKGAANLWELRQHLGCRDHKRSLPDLSYCRICWKFSLKPGDCADSHDSSGPRPPQPRGIGRVAAHWLDLYWKIHPDSTREPSPYVDDPRWRETSSPAGVRAGPTVEQRQQSFLDRGLVDNVQPFPIASFNALDEQTGQFAEAAAMHAIDVLCNSLQEGSDQLCQSMHTLMSASGPLESPHLQMLSDRFREIAERFLARLQNSAATVLEPIPEGLFPTDESGGYLSAPSPFHSSPSGQGSVTGSGSSPYLSIPQPNFRHSSAPPLNWPEDPLDQGLGYDFPALGSSQAPFPS
ncbi:hypothetical protein BCR34DRAFT_587737 [Clohesyomyces aquaticus]|uniref:C2H2-type domain-containing protein n=1 Tax=Clohesyomyces aquaticus TaxID=1231657 RepID=A0A1Y1ZND2_9PLEO|nr:hypothetical protein BCR34DRAFT_587737 [Clohesyomyces aquaticus]